MSGISGQDISASTLRMVAHDSQGGLEVLEGRDLKAFCGLLMNEDQLES